jgi:small subunit ribosomal protein S16
MVVKIRLRRTGAKKQPSYRLVVTEASSPRDGRFFEIVGHYNPRREPAELVLQEDKIMKWLGNGAQPSDTVARLLASRGLYDKARVPIRKPRKPRKGKAAAEGVRT